MNLTEADTKMERIHRTIQKDLNYPGNHNSVSLTSSQNPRM